MKHPTTPGRRDALVALTAVAALAAVPARASARLLPLDDGAASLGGDDAAAFAAQVASQPRLAPFAGIRDGTALRCDALELTGRWPAALRGCFYRNGPALFERGGRRYRHWFDGDGMVQRFDIGPRGVSHLGRYVSTPKLVAEQRAGRFLVNAFATGIASDAPIGGPDAMNVANTNVVEHAGRLLAMWEGGSAFAVDPTDLSTRGAVTWRAGLEQMPFSAHPKIDATGHLWNIGTFADKVAVWHVDPAGALAGIQVCESPYPGGMVHDVAVTPRWIVLPLPPVKMNYGAIAAGALPEAAFVYEARESLRVLVMAKDDITQRRVFELPARMVFHVGNAHERPDGRIELSFIGAADHNFLVHDAVDLAAGRATGGPHGAATHVAVLDMASGRATMETMPGNVEFPRIDPRRIGLPARSLVCAASWRRPRGVEGTLFHGLQVRDLQSGRVERYDYGEDAVVEEHIVVPKPGMTDERDAWLLGTTFDARRQVTSLNLLDARRLADGPIARAALPYWLPFGFHGNFSPITA